MEGTRRSAANPLGVLLDPRLFGGPLTFDKRPAAFLQRVLLIAQTDVRALHTGGLKRLKSGAERDGSVPRPDHKARPIPSAKAHAFRTLSVFDGPIWGAQSPTCDLLVMIPAWIVRRQGAPAPIDVAMSETHIVWRFLKLGGPDSGEFAKARRERNPKELGRGSRPLCPDANEKVYAPIHHVHVLIRCRPEPDVRLEADGSTRSVFSRKDLPNRHAPDDVAVHAKKSDLVFGREVLENVWHISIESRWRSNS